MRKAKEASMPKDNIERAIAKGTGEGGEADAIESVLYEGYGPGGVALLVEAMTENRNRTGADVRHAFSKNGGSLGEPGSVAYLFDKKGTIVIDAERYSEDDLMVAVEAGAEDITADEDVFEVVTEPADFTAVRNALEEAGVEMESAEMAYRPTSLVPIDEGQLQHADAADRGARGQRRRRRGARQLRRASRRARARRRLGGRGVLAPRAEQRHGSRMPLSRRSPAKDQRYGPSTLSRSSRSTSRLPGRATAVIRLARLTGRPNQSPARGSAWPSAAPARSWGKSSPSASAASIRRSAALSSGSGSGEASIAASPIVLTRRTGGSTTSPASASRRTARRPSSSGGTSSPRRVKPTRSAKHTGDLARARQPARRFARAR